MRSHVCQQCHVEYYFQKGTAELIFPWAMWPKGEPLRIEMVEQHYDVFRTDKDKFQQDWFHRETGAPMLKMQHPETELYSSGIHARSGVACADCHMPYQREGAVKVSNHWIRSPLFDIEASCQTCHALPADKLRERVNVIQRGTARGLRMAEQAILSLVDDISRARRVIEATSTYDKFFSLEEKEAYVSKILDPAREYHRRASMRWDFVFSENSMGFHGPQEAMRALAQAVDLARRGQLTLVNSLARAGLSLSPLTPIGQIPAPPEPITERKPPVGDPPPLPLTDFDKLLDKL
jgi:nitrite reductase (cytochrome c-552)